MAYGPYGSPYGDDPSRTPLPSMPAGWQPQGPVPVPPPMVSPMTPQQPSAIPYPGLPASAPPAYGQPAYGQPGYGPAAYGQPVHGYTTPALVPQTDPLTGEYLSPKSKVVAGLLQLFLGAFGVGRFYTGHIGLAVAQIAVGWGLFTLFFCAGFLVIVPWLFVWVGFVWPLVDGIVLLAGRQRDSAGYLLRS